MKLGLLLFLFSLILPSLSKAANFPPKVSLILKRKTSCREIKKLVKKSRLYVDCDQNSRFARAFSADYFGRRPLKKVLKEITQHSAVLGASSY